MCVFLQPRSDRDMENEAAQLRRKLSSVREENSSLVLENRQLISDLEAAQLEIASSKTKVFSTHWTNMTYMMHHKLYIFAEKISKIF